VAKSTFPPFKVTDCHCFPFPAAADTPATRQALIVRQHRKRRQRQSFDSIRQQSGQHRQIASKGVVNACRSRWPSEELLEALGAEHDFIDQSDGDHTE